MQYLVQWSSSNSFLVMPSPASVGVVSPDLEDALDGGGVAQRTRRRILGGEERYSGQLRIGEDKVGPSLEGSFDHRSGRVGDDRPSSDSVIAAIPVESGETVPLSRSK